MSHCFLVFYATLLGVKGILSVLFSLRQTILRNAINLSKKLNHIRPEVFVSFSCTKLNPPPPRRIRVSRVIIEYIISTYFTCIYNALLKYMISFSF